MYAYVNEFRSERRRELAEQMLRFRDEPVETMREIAVSSADGIKSLKAPIRALAHSGVKLAAVSQNAVQNLIGLESEIITSALTAAAMRLERAAQAEGVVDLVEVVIKATEEQVPEVKKARRKVKRAVRKTTARARNTAARARKAAA